MCEPWWGVEGRRGGGGARSGLTIRMRRKVGTSRRSQHDGDPNMKDRGMDNENTGRTAKRLMRPMTLPRMPSGVVPWAMVATR